MSSLRPKLLLPLQLLLLAITSMGAAPLWIHHAQHHHCCQIESGIRSLAGDTLDASFTSDGERTPERTSCCSMPAAKVTDSALERSALRCFYAADSSDDSLLPTAGESEHECWLCYNLSQAPSLEVESDDVAGTAVVTELTSPYRFLQRIAVECPPPARGPPLIG